MAVERSKSGQVIHLTAVNDVVLGDLWIHGISYHDMLNAGSTAIINEGAGGLGIEVFHITAPNGNSTIYQSFPHDIRIVGGLKLTTLDSGEVFIYVSRFQSGR